MKRKSLNIKKKKDTPLKNEEKSKICFLTQVLGIPSHHPIALIPLSVLASIVVEYVVHSNLQGSRFISFFLFNV